MLVRRETPADAPSVRSVTVAAFAGPDDRGGGDPPEADLVDQLRAGAAWLPRLSLVATGVDGSVIGHVVCTRAWVARAPARTPARAPALALGPLSVDPRCQGRGVGQALVHAVLGAADALDESLVALLGNPEYYRRFGFATAEEHGILAPVPQWRRHFQVRTLTAYTPALRGRFCYPEPFDQVSGG